MAKRISAAGVLLVAAVTVLSACGQVFGQELRPTAEPLHDSRPAIIASLFPQYDFARHIAGDRARVTLLLPPGAESHVFDPTYSDMAAIHRADIFIYTGAVMEPWAGRIAAGVDAASLLIVDASAGITLLDHLFNTHTHHEHNHGADPHIWLDPMRAKQMVDNIAAALVETDPENAAFYLANAAAYREKLAALDADIAAVVAASGGRSLVFGGRFAYAYFLERYQIPYRTAFDSCSTQAEPSILRMTQIINYVREHRIPVVFHEELADPRIARTIADGAGATALLFSTAHNVTRDELAQGITYIDIMRQNLRHIEKAFQ